jgi:metal-responsive CopG/Arc/MetJ family transcriptional regulator
MSVKPKRRILPKEQRKTLRISVTFPRELSTTLEQIAKEKKVSVAWVVRDATEKYVGDKWPLFASQGKGA